MVFSFVTCKQSITLLLELKSKKNHMSDLFKKYWLTHQVLNRLASVATTIFVDFYIWQVTGDLNIILKFNIGLFSIYPLAVFLGSILSEFLSLKFTQVLAKLFQFIFAGSLILLGLDLIASPFVFGLLAGLVTGISFSVADTVSAKVPPEERLSLNTNIKTGLIAIGIIIPPLFSFLVDTYQSFTIPFVIAAIIYLSLALTSLFISFPVLDGSFNLKEIFSFPGSNPEKGILLKSAFLTGIKDSIHFSLITILTLNFIGSLIGWGWFKLIVSLFSLLLIFIYRRLQITKTSIISLGLGAVIYLAGSVFFATNFNLVGICLFIFSIAIFDILFGLGHSSTMSRLTDLDTSPQDLTAEYTFFVALFTSIGALIPLVLLEYFKFDLSDPTVFLVLVVAIGLIPFSILKVMSGSFYLTHQQES